MENILRLSGSCGALRAEESESAQESGWNVRRTARDPCWLLRARTTKKLHFPKVWQREQLHILYPLDLVLPPKQRICYQFITSWSAGAQLLSSAPLLSSHSAPEFCPRFNPNMLIFLLLTFSSNSLFGSALDCSFASTRPRQYLARQLVNPRWNS